MDASTAPPDTRREGFKPPVKPAKPYLLYTFRAAFVITFVGITLLVYGFVLSFGESLNPRAAAERQASRQAIAKGLGAPSTPAAAVDKPPGKTVLEAQDSALIADAVPPNLAPVPKGYTKAVVQSRRALTPTEIVQGYLSGDPHKSSLFFLGIGVAVTVLFGFASIALWVLIEP